MDKMRFASYLFAGKAAAVLPFFGNVKADDAVPADLSATAALTADGGTLPRHAWYGIDEGYTISEWEDNAHISSDSYGSGISFPASPDAELDIKISGGWYGDTVYLIGSTTKDGWSQTGDFVGLRCGSPDNYKILLVQTIKKPDYAGDGVAEYGGASITFTIDPAKVGLANAGSTIYIQAVIFTTTIDTFTQQPTTKMVFSELDTITATNSSSTYSTY